MTTEMSEERLAEIEARAEAATRGPWIVSEEWVSGIGFDRNVRMIKGAGDEYVADERGVPSDWDAAFAAAARQDVPALVAEVRRLRAAPTPEAIEEGAQRARLAWAGDDATVLCALPWAELEEDTRADWRSVARALLKPSPDGAPLPAPAEPPAPLPGVTVCAARHAAALGLGCADVAIGCPSCGAHVGESCEPADLRRGLK